MVWGTPSSWEAVSRALLVMFGLGATAEPGCTFRTVIRWLLVSWAVNAVVLGVTGALLHGVTFGGSTWTLIWAAAVFGILNTLLKPILKLITFPLAIFTLGIAWFFVSMLMLWLTALSIPKFDIDGFWNYVWATIIVWAVNLVLDTIIFRPARSAGSVAAV
jgi:putative membrane protein